LTDEAGGYHLKLASSSAALSAMQNNLIYEAESAFRVYWGATYTSLNSFQAATGKGQGCVFVNPRFVDGPGADFRLGAGSAARDAGTSLAYYTDLFASRFPTTIAFDRIGVSRPQGAKWDIGAYETIGPAAPKNLRVVPRP
jgi:hypothetical protein